MSYTDIQPGHFVHVSLRNKHINSDSKNRKPILEDTVFDSSQTDVLKLLYST